MKNILKTFAISLLTAAAACVHAQKKNFAGDAPGETTKLEKAAEKMPDHPAAPAEYRRPAGYVPHLYEKSLLQLKDEYSDMLEKKSAAEYARIERVIADGKWKATASGIDAHKCPEWFEDAKFGIFVDWGLWSLASWAPKREKGAMYPDWYELRMYSDFNSKSPFWGYRSYHVKNWGKDFERDHFIPLFKAERYNPEALVEVFKDAGAKYVVPFAKHHSGFCLWDSSYTFRDSVDMGPKKDLMGLFSKACRDGGLKFGFYFSLDEWEYPIIGGDGKIINSAWAKTEPYSPDMESKASGKIAVKDFVKDYLVPQAAEFIDKYSPDILWYDGEWMRKAKDLGGYTISSYFYNVNEGKKEVAVNDRYGIAEPEEIAGKFTKRQRNWLRTVRGDFFTDEYGDSTERIDPANHHPWEANRGISQSFGNNWQDDEHNVVSASEFIKIFSDIVGRGGNLLLIVNLDGQGGLPEIQKKRLLDIGGWLKKNGEAVYCTRTIAPFATPDVSYTRSKDAKTAYAIVKNLKSDVEIQLSPVEGSDVVELSEGAKLGWRYADASKSAAIVSLGEFAKRDLPVVLKIRLK